MWLQNMSIFISMMKQNMLSCGLNSSGMQSGFSSFTQDNKSFLLRMSEGKLHFLMAVILILSFGNAKAQEPLMAKANMMLTVSYGATNFNRIVLDKYLTKQSVIDPSISYDIKYSNPLSANVDYAISDYTSLGIGVNYYSFDLKETRKDIVDSFDLDTKGHRIAIQVRAMRYIIQRPRSIIYFFAGAGARFRSVKYNSSDSLALHTADIHHTADGSLSSYSPISLDVGLGLKFLVVRNIGVSAEFGMMTGIGQIGLFYSFKNKWRRSRDNIGW